MKPYYVDDSVTLYHGDCIEVMRTLPDNSVDAVVCDPPYGLGFMGREWDSIKASHLPPSSVDKGSPLARMTTGKGPAAVAFDGVAFQEWCTLWAAECLRVLKPGGHLLAFGGTRTWHRLACAVEDAGFEVRDSIAWLYGSGFPKSLDVSKAIDAKLTTGGSGPTHIRRRDMGDDYQPSPLAGTPGYGDGSIATAAGGGNGRERGDARPLVTPDAERWQGWGTALKPAFEPIVVARKPLQSTVAANVLEHGAGALNIDGCRVEGAFESGWSKSGSKASENDSMSGPNYARDPKPDNPSGRWPTNVLLDDSQAAELDRQSGTSVSRVGKPRGAANGDGWGMTATGAEYDDQGGASRFFPTFRYEAKAPTSERPRVNGTAHPTVKPLDLMRWLVRLVTPPGGTVLEPFAGSGTTAEACVVEGFRCIAIEREADYLPLIVQRLTKPIEPVLDLSI